MPIRPGASALEHPRRIDGDRAETGGRRRSFLFLQGNATRFFGRLGLELHRRGHAVHRVNFNGGDALFWRLPHAEAFRGHPDAWPARLAQIVSERSITDIIMFGDCRPVHLPAVKLAREGGVVVHVLEEGYLRPNWITFERDGVNGNSRLPRSAEGFLEAAASLPALQPAERADSSFARRATEDVLYHLARVATSWRYPHYRFHAPTSPLVDYAEWIARMVTGPLEAKRSEAVPGVLAGRKFYLLPLQLDADYQVRVHSDLGRMLPALEQILRSFADHAPRDALLVCKAHPLETRIGRWRRRLARIAAQMGVAKRVFYVHSRDLQGLVRASRGLVTINSTVGAVSLAMGRPTIALGKAVYNVPGLTFSRGLDRFWTEATPPDPKVYAAFERVLRARCLVHGSFYSTRGIEIAVREIADRLERPEPVAERRPVLRSVPVAAVLV